MFIFFADELQSLKKIRICQLAFSFRLNVYGIKHLSLALLSLPDFRGNFISKDKFYASCLSIFIYINDFFVRALVEGL